MIYPSQVRSHTHLLNTCVLHTHPSDRPTPTADAPSPKTPCPLHETVVFLECGRINLKLYALYLRSSGSLHFSQKNTFSPEDALIKHQASSHSSGGSLWLRKTGPSASRLNLIFISECELLQSASRFWRSRRVLPPLHRFPRFPSAITLSLRRARHAPYP